MQLRPSYCSLISRETFWFDFLLEYLQLCALTTLAILGTHYRWWSAHLYFNGTHGALAPGSELGNFQLNRRKDLALDANSQKGAADPHFAPF